MYYVSCKQFTIVSRIFRQLSSEYLGFFQFQINVKLVIILSYIRPAHRFLSSFWDIFMLKANSEKS